MRQLWFLVVIAIALGVLSCENEPDRLTVVNSTSFPDVRISLDGFRENRLSTASDEQVFQPTLLQANLDELTSLAETVGKTRSDTDWDTLSVKWDKFRTTYTGSDGTPVVQNADSLDESATRQWVELNSRLLRFSGDVKFGDALEKMLYDAPVAVFPEKLLKSIIYTHIDDHIFINLFGPSILTHQHTTGGTIKLIQETDFPESNEVILKCECSDTRYLNVFIRIPEWAVNPTVSHGNVKYVATPGEYCQVSRKWRDGDEFSIKLKN